ncbi:hypothetical protein F4780DRAFT_276171 [Xylariomycetidae sp. FL0641]|nr:hypothetical protein F4780DRAFT_276171 [Xylariomycetidae sp. FL0641]
MKLPTLLAVFCSSSFQALGSAELLQKPIGGSPSTPHLSSSSSSSAPAYRDELVSLHHALVEIPSITYNEKAVGDFLVQYLKDRGFATARQPVPPPASADNNNNNTTTVSNERFNVLAWRAPAGGGDPSPRVVVSSHIDTVPPYIPYSRRRVDGEDDDVLIAGRGSVDAKASVAAQIVAVTQLAGARRIADGDVLLAFVVGEERAGDGMRAFSDRLREKEGVAVEAAVFGEPTEGKLACGHKGFFGCRVQAAGRAGHSGYPWLGKSATEVLMRGLLRVLDADLGSSDAFGNTTINVGVLEGGVAANVIPEKAVAEIAGRVAIGPEEEGGRVVAERVVEVLKSVDEEAFEVECRNGYGVVRTVCDVEGFETITVNYGTDVPNFKGNHTRYLYGPGTIFVAHGPDEAIKRSELEAAVEGYKKLILHALSK